jgi:hypothetical protein
VELTFSQTGNDEAFWSTITELPFSMADDHGVLNMRLNFALLDRDWSQAKELLEKMKGGEDEGYFAYGSSIVPIGCYSILLARLQGENAAAPKFSEVRKQLNYKVRKTPEDAGLLSDLAVVDALLNDKKAAVAEADDAVKMLPISQDAVIGPGVLTNLAVVYAWTNELDQAFDTLDSLTKAPLTVLSYGELKRGLYWEPLRRDSRYEKVLAKMKKGRD